MQQAQIAVKDGQKANHQKETKENPSIDHNQRDTENKQIRKEKEHRKEN